MTEPLTFPLRNSGPFSLPGEIAALRGEREIAPLHYPDGRSGWVVTRRSTIRSVLADPRFSARQELRTTQSSEIDTAPPAAPGMFISMDPPDHTRYRRVLTGQFTVRRMRRLADRIAEIAEDCLDRMEAAGPPADLVRDYAVPIPAQMICEMLGVPDDFRDTFHRELIELSRSGASLETHAQTMARVNAYLGELVARKRAEPTDDVLGGIIEDGGDLSDAAIVNMAFLLLGGGFDTTTNMLALGTFALVQDPGQIPLITDPATVDNAVEELLRYLPVVPGTIRAALEDVELEGVTVKKGDNVLVALPAGNRDPERFADPDTLDLARSANGHISFGHGVHQCIGQQLARVEMQVAFPALFRRFPDLRLAVAPEDVPLRDDMVIFGAHELPVTWGPR
ncbi:cytochrome P450 [Nocardiopsis sediminis]|uniref:Cytochrome P450 n=1 Tax=Nocardiopsis sediminis TaxID=1778267 RepID=A0ABV8FNB8_9ACTN